MAALELKLEYKVCMKMSLETQTGSNTADVNSFVCFKYHMISIEVIQLLLCVILFNWPKTVDSRYPIPVDLNITIFIVQYVIPRL